MRTITIVLTALTALAVLLLAACAAPKPDTTTRSGPAPRLGDEIVVAGHLFHTGAPVVLWFDEGGYDAYSTGRRFADSPRGGALPAPDPLDNARRYSARDMPGDPGTLADLQHKIDQFVIHYDACGSSRQCFKVLHDVRGLSVHFLLDTDGTIYQTLDCKERAWHATVANDRSVGIEIANIGAYPIGDGARRVTTQQVESSPLADWYARDKAGYFLTLPGWLGDGGSRTPGFLAGRPRPARPLPVTGEIQGRTLTQFDLTDAQYDSLAKLTATLCAVFPNLPRTCPRTLDGRLITCALPPEQLANYRGLLGHYHVQPNKIDPGPAFDWGRVVGPRATDR